MNIEIFECPKGEGSPIEKFEDEANSYFLFGLEEKQYQHLFFGEVMNIKCAYGVRWGGVPAMDIMLKLSFEKEKLKRLLTILRLKEHPRWRVELWELKGLLISSEDDIENIKEIAIAYWTMESVK